MKATAMEWLSIPTVGLSRDRLSPVTSLVDSRRRWMGSIPAFRKSTVGASGKPQAPCSVLVRVQSVLPMQGTNYLTEGPCRWMCIGCPPPGALPSDQPRATGLPYMDQVS